MTVRASSARSRSDRLRALRTRIALGALLVTAVGCTSSGQSGSAFVFLPPVAVSPAGGVTSSLEDKNTSTVACVTLQNNPKNPTVTTPTGLDSVFITSYTVRLTRSDGGPPPA